MFNQLPALALLALLVVSCSEIAYETGQSALPYSEELAPSAVPASPTNYPLSSSASLDDLVAASLARHPSLTALRSRASAIESAAEKARYLPDPIASAGAGSLAETAAGQVQASLSVQQRIPFPGKRSTQAAMLLDEARAVRAQLQSEELALAERVRMAWWNYSLSRKKATILAESRDVLDTLRNPVEARIATGEGAQADLLKLDNEVTSIAQRLAILRGSEAAAAATLNALLIRPPGASLPTPSDPSFRNVAPASSLLARASLQHPEVLRAQALIASAQNRVTLARLEGRPDFTAGLGWNPVEDGGIARSATGKDQFMATLGVNIPLWAGKSEASRQSASGELAAAQSALSATRSLLQQQVGSAYAAYVAESAALQPFASKLIPNARDTFELSLTSYQTGKATFLDIIDSWRQLLSYEVAYLENQTRLGQAESALIKAAAL